MKKLFAMLCICLLLSACVRNKENPLNNLSAQQITQIPNQRLCQIVRSKRYKPSNKGTEEMQRRGLIECSNAELYCINLGFKPQSNGYAACRFEYSRQSAARMSAMAASMQANQPVYIQTQPTVVNHSYNYVYRRSGAFEPIPLPRPR